MSWFPAELRLGLGRVAEQQVDLRGTEVAGVDFHIITIIER